jgi:hypothetical protein
LTLRLARAVCTSVLLSLALAACGGGEGVSENGDPATAADTATGTPSTGTISRASISGTPANQVTVGTQYSFTPTASDSDGGTLAYSVSSAPSWASFNSKTGQLSGSPTTADIGTTEGIVITVADGTATASLPAFSLNVVSTASAGTGSAKVTWVAPTENSNGTELTDLGGYYVHYGTDASELSEVVQISNSKTLSYEVTALATGKTWYFAVSSYTSTGVQSSLSAVSSKSL